jgi:hypothetical protein
MRSASVDELSMAWNALWISSADIEAAWLHRGLLNDRLRVGVRRGVMHKLLGVRNKSGTDLLQESLRGWIDNRLVLD